MQVTPIEPGMKGMVPHRKKLSHIVWTVANGAAGAEFLSMASLPGIRFDPCTDITPMPEAQPAKTMASQLTFVASLWATFMQAGMQCRMSQVKEEHLCPNICCVRRRRQVQLCARPWQKGRQRVSSIMEEVKPWRRSWQRVLGSRAPMRGEGVKIPCSAHIFLQQRTLLVWQWERLQATESVHGSWHLQDRWQWFQSCQHDAFAPAEQTGS